MKIRKVLLSVLLVGGVAALLIILDYMPKPANTFFWRTLFDGGHAPLFGVMSVLVLFLSTLVIRGQNAVRLWHYAAAFGIPTFIGIVVEVLQINSRRDADPWDAVTNMIGSLAFLIYFATIDTNWPDRLGKIISRFKLSLRLIALLLMAIPLVPPLLWAVATLQRNSEFPVLLTFEKGWEEKYLEATYATIQYVEPPSEWVNNQSEQAGLIFFDTTKWGYPSLALREPFPDWRGYDSLAFVLYSPHKQNKKVYIRVNDRRHNEAYSDRYNESLTVRPGENRFAIPISRIESAPAGRSMNLGLIRELKLFIDSKNAPFELYVDDIELR
ncbi:MAG: hypothetical protein SGI97_11415 [candidate division Zixibacteria bacterium]|nr:hypothetical protein [candidate division Zixibacteria bacterium]